MIIWTGWGVLTVLIAGAGLVLGVLLDPVMTSIGLPTQTSLVVAWILAAIVNWFVGVRLNGAPGRELVDPATGQRVVLRRRHALFWIPMQYYSILMLIFGALAVLGALGFGTPKPAR